MAIHIIGDKGFVLRDPRVEDGADADVGPSLAELEAVIREKFPQAKFLVMISTPNGRSSFLAGDADGPLRRDLGANMAKRLHQYLTTSR